MIRVMPSVDRCVSSSVECQARGFLEQLLCNVLRLQEWLIQLAQYHMKWIIWRLYSLGLLSPTTKLWCIDYRHLNIILSQLLHNVFLVQFYKPTSVLKVSVFLRDSQYIIMNTKIKSVIINIILIRILILKCRFSTNSSYRVKQILFEYNFLFHPEANYKFL